MGLKAHLEKMCNVIDDVLAGHGLAARVAGGYIAGNGVLFSLTDTTFLNTRVRLELEEALQVSKVLATVGVVLVNGWVQRQESGEQVRGAGDPAPPPLPAPEVKTVNVLDLIAMHEADQPDGRSLPPDGRSLRPDGRSTRPSSTPIKRPAWQSGGSGAAAMR